MPEATFAAERPLTQYRAVHFDLKGLPPTPERLLSMLDLFAALRYNAVLVEWEDMFPWTVDERFRSEVAYTPAQVSAFAKKAKGLGIEVIPLVQTMGHMETFLRPADYAGMREIPHLCDGLNPLAPGARQLVERLIDDVLALLPGPKHFHLGGDEAWTFGQHPDTKRYVEQHGKGALYLHHVQPLLDKLNARHVRPILWHDMMVEWDDASQKKLAGSADLCAWGYWKTPDESDHHFATRHIERFHRNGITLWGATAYKGAEGHNSDLPDPSRRQHNALGWTDLAKRIPFKGLVTTAWSRYNTNLPQCEPIDGALDMLALHGVILHDGKAPSADAASLLPAGERERLERVKPLLQRLAELRKSAWTAVQDVRERLAMLRREPGRSGSGQQVKRLKELLKFVDELKGVGKALTVALADSVPATDLEGYLDERIAPLADELTELKAAVSKVDPTGAAAEGVC